MSLRRLISLAVLIFIATSNFIIHADPKKNGNRKNLSKSQATLQNKSTNQHSNKNNTNNNRKNTTHQKSNKPEHKLSKTLSQLKKNICQLDAQIKNTKRNFNALIVNELNEASKKFDKELDSIKFITNKLLLDLKKLNLSQSKKDYFTNELNLITGLSHSLKTEIDSIKELTFKKKIITTALISRKKVSRPAIKNGEKVAPVVKPKPVKPVTKSKCPAATTQKTPSKPVIKKDNNDKKVAAAVKPTPVKKTVPNFNRLSNQSRDERKHGAEKNKLRNNEEPQIAQVSKVQTMPKITSADPILAAQAQPSIINSNESPQNQNEKEKVEAPITNDNPEDDQLKKNIRLQAAKLRNTRKLIGNSFNIKPTLNQDTLSQEALNKNSSINSTEMQDDKKPIIRPDYENLLQATFNVTQEKLAQISAAHFPEKENKETDLSDSWAEDDNELQQNDEKHNFNYKQINVFQKQPEPKALSRSNEQKIELTKQEEEEQNNIQNEIHKKILARRGLIEGPK